MCFSSKRILESPPRDETRHLQNYFYLCPMILLIDNNDSFTYNVVELLRQVTTQQVVVLKSHALTVEQVESYDTIILSPGPGLPDDFPILAQILRQYDDHKRILGICLGHQTICQYYGGRLINLPQVMHGVESEIECDPNSLLFNGMNVITVGRYHSWAATDIPPTLKITATDQDGTVMAVEHRTKQVFGLQFHPESFITLRGKQILKNFIDGAAK